ncbi:HAD hydrolase family protein [Nostoc sp. CENA67]|uniref:HAD hydrolase family protein n=2 Tax=Amazonocrinis TaxID=2840440 RepID=A0A8J7HVS7_9NOST|nr:HAD hydrolase family protein [Amazonocrinis nigriterrae CENA67]
MFKIADHAITVANADAELKRYASLVIGLKNTEDSVVKYIQHLWSNRYGFKSDSDTKNILNLRLM